MSTVTREAGTAASSGGKTISQMARDEQAFYDAQEMTVGCADCGWSFTGPAGEGRAAAAAHRDEAHPGVAEQRRLEREREERERKRKKAAADASRRSSRPVVAPRRLPAPGRPQHSSLAQTSQLDELKTGGAGSSGEAAGSTGKATPCGKRGKSWTRERVVGALVAWWWRRGELPRRREWASTGDGHPTQATVYSLFSTWREAIDAAVAELALLGYVAEPPPDERRSMRQWTKETVAAAIKEWADAHGGEPPSANEWRKKVGWFPSTSSVVSVFGSWTAALEAAGLARPERSGKSARMMVPAAPREVPCEFDGERPPGDGTEALGKQRGGIAPLASKAPLAVSKRAAWLALLDAARTLVDVYCPEP